MNGGQVATTCVVCNSEELGAALKGRASALEAGEDTKVDPRYGNRRNGSKCDESG